MTDPALSGFTEILSLVRSQETKRSTLKYYFALGLDFNKKYDFKAF